MMNEEEKNKVKNALKHHASILELFINDNDWQIKSYYLPLAGQLRVLLCDSSLPILITYANEVGKDLVIVNRSPEIEEESKRPILAMNFEYCGWDSLHTADTISIQAFLEKKIGTTPITINNKQVGGPYSPKQLIKWIANKEGIAHLDLKEPQTLSSLKKLKFQSGDLIVENFIVQRKIMEIAKWTMIAIHYLLEDETLDQFKSVNLSKLQNIDLIDIDSISRIAHYVHYQQNNCYFEGEHGFSVCNVNSQTINKFTFNTVIKIIPQLHIGKRTLFELINDTDSIILNVSFDINKNLLLDFDGTEYLICNLMEDLMLESYFNFSIEIDLRNKEIDCFVNAEKISHLNIQTQIESIRIKDYHIGISNSRNDALSCFIKETIIISQILEDLQRKQLLKYYCKTIN